jgi:predicted N-acetyltransferase YhbS
MITIRRETRFDFARREALLDEAFAEGRFGKTAERLRKDRLPEQGLSFVACVDNRRPTTSSFFSPISSE